MNTRILLVEDDERLADLTAEYLTKNDLQVSIEPRGDRAEGVAVLTRAMERATARRQPTHLAELWHDAARLELLDLLGGLDEWPRPAARLAQARCVTSL